MPTRWSDTHPAAEQVLIEGYRRMTPADKLKRVVSLTQGVQQMALLRLREKYPEDSERQLQYRLASLWIDAETMRRAVGWDPEVEGR